MKRGKSRSVRSRKRKHGVGSVDGICDLPDSILGHILSFLPTKNAVATSILSQRWKFLWTTISSLDFDCCSDREDEDDRFVEFVNYVLLLNKPGCLNRFSLIWIERCIPFHVNAWISAAIARNVCELILCLGLSELSNHVQRSMFSCESLRSLELRGSICISHEIVVSLPKLESLTLVSVFFESEETLCKLLGGCPVLKYLCLQIDMVRTKESCLLDDGIAFRCIISSTSLRRLELYAYDEDRHFFNKSICGVQLHAPSLNYIILDQISSISIRQSLIFMIEANVQLVEPAFKDEIHYNSVIEAHYNSVVEAFRAFDCAKTLVLSHEVITAFDLASIEMKTIFSKLTRLEVTNDWNYWSSLHKFIMMSDNIEVFIVNKDRENGRVYYNPNEHLTAIQLNLVPRCISNRLRMVSIGCYAGTEDEFAMVSYIIKHGSVLELMEINFWGIIPLEEKDEMIKRIRKLPRKSTVCEVEFT